MLCGTGPRGVHAEHHFTIMWASDPRNGATGFGVSFLFGFSLSLVQCVLLILLFLPFGMGIFTLCHYI